MGEKKYGDPDFGCTLAELKLQAELAKTVTGVSFDGNARKVGAILAVAGAGSKLIADIEQLTSLRDELVEVLIQCRSALNTAYHDVTDEVGRQVIARRVEAANAVIAKAKGGAA